MPLPATTYPRPRLAATTSEAIQLTAIQFEDAANNRMIYDWHGTANAAIRLFHRLIVTPVIQGTQLKVKIQTQSYQTNGNSVYDPTSLATATAAPFTIDPAKLETVGETVPIDCDVIYTAAGDART